MIKKSMLVILLGLLLGLAIAVEASESSRKELLDELLKGASLDEYYETHDDFFRNDGR